jgi:hypothetical protein
MVLGYLQKAPRAALAGALILIIAIVDWRAQANIAFGFLYILPMLWWARYLPLWSIVLTASLCTVLADVFDPFAFTLNVGLPQDILVFTSLTGTGLYSYEITRRGDRERKHLMTVELEANARRIAEEQLEFLIESSPAAILTMGRITGFYGGIRPPTAYSGRRPANWRVRAYGNICRRSGAWICPVSSFRLFGPKCSAEGSGRQATTS